MRYELNQRLDALEVNIVNELHELRTQPAKDFTTQDEVHDVIVVLDEALEKVYMLRGMLENFIVPDDESVHFGGFEDVIMDLEKAMEKEGAARPPSTGDLSTPIKGAPVYLPEWKGVKFEDCKNIDWFQTIC